MNAPWKKATFFGALYFLQGAAFAYVVNFQKPYLAGQGVSKESLGLFTSLLLLPFIFKVFLGMLSDRVPVGRWGSRKPYMVLGLILFSLCYFTLSQIAKPAESFMFFACVTWLASLGLALFDTCCDALAVDISAESEQGMIQAAMVGGRALGLITMASGFGMWAETYGFQLIFIVLAVLALVMIGLVVAVPTTLSNVIPIAKAQKQNGLSWKHLLTPAYLIFAVYGICYSIASFGVDGIATLFLQEVKNASPSDLGRFGAFRGLGAIGGAAIALAMIRQHKDLSAVAWRAMIGLGMGCLIVAGGNIDYGFFWGIAWGLQETVYMALAMHYSRGPWSATFFAIAMIFSNVGTAIGEGLAAPLAASQGYYKVFWVFAGLCFVLALFCRRSLKIKKPV